MHTRVSRSLLLVPNAVCSVARSATLFVLVLLGSSCDDGTENGSRRLGLSDSTPASAFGPELAKRWMDLSYTLVKTLPGYSPPVASRAFGYTGVALYESVVRGVEGRRSLAGQLNGLAAGAIPEPTDEVHDWPSVANQAIATVLAALFPDGVAEIDALREEIEADLAGGADMEVIARSITYGEEIGNAILAWAATDGIADVPGCNGAFTAPVVDGSWVGTGSGLMPCWGTMRTFALENSDECPAVPHPTFSTDPGSDFFAHALLVFNTTGDDGANLSADQRDIAMYWADFGGTGTPPGHWIAITGIVSEQEMLPLDLAAEAYARVGIAVADAFISCWRTKFTTFLQRPITYIRANVPGGADWDPIITTPNFPTYSSGHSTQSGAAATVLTDLLGPVAFVDTTHSDLNPELGMTDRSFANFAEAANEAAISRLYGGIHFVFDNEDGVDQGVCIGSIIASRLDFAD